MKRYKITTHETIWTTYEIEVPDDCSDPTQFFYDMEPDEQASMMLENNSHEWEVDNVEEIKP